MQKSHARVLPAMRQAELRQIAKPPPVSERRVVVTSSPLKHLIASLEEDSAPAPPTSSRRLVIGLIINVQ